MRHLPVIGSFASAASPVQSCAILQLGLRGRTVRTDVRLIVHSPGPEPCGSGIEIHSGTPETRRQFYSAESVTRRCVGKAARWVRATPDSGGYLPRQVRSAPAMRLEQ